MYCVGCIMFGIANKNYVIRPDSNSYLGQQSLSQRTSRYVTGPCPRFVRGEGGKNMFPYFRWYLLCGGGIDGFCSTTKYTPFMIYLQNRLICNRHCSTEYNKLLYVCGGGILWIACLFCRFLIYSTCNFAIPGTSIAGMRESGVQIPWIIWV